MATIWMVDRAVDEIAMSRIQRFYPTLVAKRTGLPVEVVFERLLQLSIDGKLKLKWEVRCPNCFRNIIVYDQLPELKDIIYDCVCGEEVEISRELIFPAFEIDEGYRLSFSYATTKKNKIREMALI